MKKIYDAAFLIGVHAHILLDQILVRIEQLGKSKNGSK